MNKYFFNHDLSPLLGLADSQIITFIGGGGKTSLMNTLGKEFASHGYPTLLTTTTHIMKPDFLSDESYIENEDLGQLANIFTNLKKNTLPLAALGIPEKVVNSNIKWRSPSSDFCEKIAEFSKKFSTKNPYKFFKILCEGDGSKRLPIKLPKDGEPVFFPKTDTVIGVIGLSCLGKPIKETLFRYELLPNLTSLDNYFIKSLQSADIVTTDFLYRLCLSEKGLRKNITSQKFCIIFNQADILDEKALAEVITLRNQLQTKGICPHIISVKNNYIIN
ncbi:selenium cofactor biosynthesis protein YqeC [Anaerobutyricum hallii]|mgnify:FL=1|jgi:probable selenium-dependent hydroxylase accessory protein YqeC|uniref:selenium cofactor biosynthesis protein YqeC n=1 Tax=Anaerobutyricum hallii TaxID=39488 RepID=UPI00242A5C14|nr:selenium cofactor biosynthesis protein YqeC [Anaerobutyricum hallii]